MREIAAQEGARVIVISAELEAQIIQLLEPDIKEAQRVFHSPIISITFGKLF